MNGNLQAIERGSGQVAGNSSLDIGPIVFCCPRCRGPLEHVGRDSLRCDEDRLTFGRVDGIWRMLLDERGTYFQSFIQDYETIRRGEERGAGGPEFYRQLPFSDTTAKFSADWRIRARSYEALIDRFVSPMESQQGFPLRILDLGAGNCWLSNRLADRGHDVVAVDLLTNREDGLGAHVHYETRFVPVQAEFDHLPFVDEQMDLVVFNGSLHYSTDYRLTLDEALRMLCPHGELVIVDSPIYRDAASGRQMVYEREAGFEERFGFASNAISSENFLTYVRLDELALDLSVQWTTFEPNYGIAWKVKPWRAKLRRRREPARFLLISAAKLSRPVNPLLSLKRRVARRWLWFRFNLTQRRRYNHLTIEEVAGRSIVVLPQVFNPKLLRSGAFLAEVVADGQIPAGAAVLDMGTGSGVCAIVAASRAGWVVAIDINPHAVRCARVNAILNEVDDTIQVRKGDLFAPVQGERFDIVLFNPPYFRGVPAGALDQAWRSVDVVERFAAELDDHLLSGGSALVVLSTDGDSRAFLKSFRQNGFSVIAYKHKDFMNEVLTVYRLQKQGRSGR